MSSVEERVIGSKRDAASPARPPGDWSSSPLVALARPLVAGAVALVVYLWRAMLEEQGLQRTDVAFFNYLADAFLHGQLSLRLLPPSTHDLVFYEGHFYLYWPPFPAIVVMPLVALAGVEVSDVVYTVVLAALAVALVAWLLAALTETGVAPLSADRRAILVLTVAFGSVLLILAPVGRVWFTAQVIGLICMLLAAIAALSQPGRRGYLLAGVALGCAMATRLPLLFSGLWLAYYLLWRDWRRPFSWRLTAVGMGLAPIILTTLLFGWYNAARFGGPLEMGLDWHLMEPRFQAEYDQYGPFHLHYLPTNLYYQFLAHPLLPGHDWQMGGGIFWMTPVLLGAVYALWRCRRQPLVWALLATCALLYIPIGLLMGTGWVTFGPRYLLDLTVPLLALTALGIARWSRPVLLALLLISVLTYGIGSWLWLITDI